MATDDDLIDEYGSLRCLRDPDLTDKEDDTNHPLWLSMDEFRSMWYDEANESPSNQRSDGRAEQKLRE